MARNQSWRRTRPWKLRGVAMSAAFSMLFLAGEGRVLRASQSLPSATVTTWNITSTIGFNPGESVEDISGLTGHVATAADPLTIVASIENASHFQGPCGVIFWNPATNFFKWYGITGGSSFGIDLNLTAPALTGPDGGVFGAPTFQSGDVWVTVNGGGPPLYVNLKGTDNFRFYFIGGTNGVHVDQTTGHVWTSDLFAGSINRLDPATNAFTSWSVGGAPHFLAQDSAGRIYSAVGSAGVAGGVDAIVRIDPSAAVNNVTSWPVTGGGLQDFLSFATPNGVAFDSAGNLWFAESDSNEIGRLNPSTGEMCEFTKTGLLNPQLVASSGSGGSLQTFFTEGNGNSVSIVTQAEAVPITSPCPVVTPITTTVTPGMSTAFFSDSIRTPLTATILPTTVEVPGVDGTPSGGTTTADGIPIPGILRFPMPTPAGGNPAAPNFPSGMTGVSVPNTVFGSYLDPAFSQNSAVFRVESGAIIAPPPGAIEGFMTGGGSVFTAGGVRVTHGFQLHCDAAELPNNLEVNWGKGNRFHLESLTSAACTDDPTIDPGSPAAPFDTYVGEGTGRYNGVSGATVKFTFTDAGEPGSNDMATIVISDSSGVVLTVTGKLDRGNHQAHPE